MGQEGVHLYSAGPQEGETVVSNFSLTPMQILFKLAHYNLNTSLVTVEAISTHKRTIINGTLIGL